MTVFPSVDHLRPASLVDRLAPIAKDWLHLNVFDHRGGAVAVVNASLHGDVWRDRGLVVGCCLVHVPGSGWAGGVEILDAAEARLDPGFVGLATMGFALPPDRSVILSVCRPDVRGKLTATPAAADIVVEEPLPFGSGWISWRAVPRLTAQGWLQVAGTPVDISTASVYHDHNWGRWRWGDDAGWDWGTVLAPDGGPSIVLFRPTRRARRGGDPGVSVHVAGRQVRFSGPSVYVLRSGRYAGPVHRVPGAAAALRGDRRRPVVPASVRLVAGGREAGVEVEWTVDAVAQIVCAEPAVPGQAFIHELCGRATYDVRLGPDRWRGETLGVFEHVD